MTASTMSFAVTPGASAPSTVIAIVLNGLSGNVWVASTCSTSLVPMPKASAPKAPCVEVCESPQTIVMPGWVEPELRADDVHDALLRIAHREQPDAELGAIGAQRVDLDAGDRIGDQQVDRPVGRDVVILGRQGEIGPAHRAAGQPQALEGLRAGHLVHQVQVDVQQVGLTLRGVHDVCVPDLFGECLPHCRPFRLWP